MDWNRILPFTAEDRLQLSEAYTRVFCAGNATKEDKEAVLNDIMSFSGYFSVTMDSGDLHFNEGKRAVAGLIFSMTFMPEAEREALFKATRQTQIEGQRYAS